MNITVYITNSYMRDIWSEIRLFLKRWRCHLKQIGH